MSDALPGLSQPSRRKTRQLVPGNGAAARGPPCALLGPRAAARSRAAPGAHTRCRRSSDPSSGRLWCEQLERVTSLPALAPHSTGPCRKCREPTATTTATPAPSPILPGLPPSLGRCSVSPAGCCRDSDPFWLVSPLHRYGWATHTVADAGSRLWHRGLWRKVLRTDWIPLAGLPVVSLGSRLAEGSSPASSGSRRLPGPAVDTMGSEP